MTLGKRIIKALSIKQPYASWIAQGKKTIETRTWRTNYRGAFLVVASRSADLVRMLELKPEDYPTGLALAIARIINCRPMMKGDEQAACCKLYERAYAWELADVKKIEPFPVKGQLGFFNVEMPA